MRIGNYRVLREVVSGPTGVTYEVEHVMLPRVALLKLMHPQATWSRAFAVQVLREACILEALDHAGVPRVYESGVMDKRPWFAIERVDGEPLSARVADGLLTPLELAVVLRDAAAVLEHAHRRGVIHGGIRPDSILATGHERGFPLCITDWSDARTYDTASLGGPPVEPSPYLAPEVLRRDSIDDRADVYALGAVAQAVAELSEAPRELIVLLRQMTAYDRYDRPSSGEVVSELAWAAQYASHRADTFRDTAQAALDAIHLLEPDDVQLVDTDGVPANANAPMPRIRRPRWTPTGAITSDHVPEVAGEIGDTPPEDHS